MLMKILNDVAQSIVIVINIVKLTFQSISSLFWKLTAYLLFPNLHQLPTLAARHPQGIGIARIGFGPFKRHIVMIDSAQQTPQLNAKLLEQIMSLPEPDARKFYRYFHYVTGGASFLGMNDASATSLRKHHILPYLNPKYVYQDARVGLFRLFKKISELNQYGELANVFKHHVFDELAKTFFDVTMDDDLKKLLLDIEDSSLNTVFSLAPEMLLKQLNYFPKMRTSLQSYDQLIRKFLRKKIEEICQTEHCPTDRPNWWFDIIRAKFPNQSPQHLSDADIETLLNDDAIRTSLATVLAVSNITSAMNIMVRYFFATPAKNIPIFLSALRKEIEEKSDDDGIISQSNLLSYESMPLLHAAYLEVLRHSGSQVTIPRYTQKGCELESGIKLPPHSHIIFKVNLPIRSFGSTEYPAKKFAPARFLDNGKLTEEAKQALNSFHIFGVGPRSCPGRYTAEIFLKYYLAGFARYIKSITDTVEFYQPPTETPIPHAEDKFTFFIHSYKSLFNQKKTLNESKIDSNSLDFSHVSLIRSP